MVIQNAQFISSRSHTVTAIGIHTISMHAY